MTRYADPHACPDCRGPLDLTFTACPRCRLPLDGAVAAELFQTLRRADDLLVRLRARPAAAPALTPAPLPVAARPRPERSGIRATSVPGVLLGLGALCLLVAAVIFLAVAWSWLGVGGRTAVLIGLTAASAAAGLGTAKRGLRVAGEALAVVALGLVALDVVGADRAGWMGRLDDAGLALVVGTVLTAAALAIAAAPVRLILPQVIAGVAALVAYAGALGSTRNDAFVDAATVLVLAGLAWAGRHTGRDVFAYAAGLAAALPWLHLTLDALGRGLEDPTLREVWAGPGPALVAAALLALLPAALGWRDVGLVQAAGGVAATLLTIAALLPVVDEGLTRITVAALAAQVAWTLVTLVVPVRWRGLPMVPAVAAAMPVAVVVGVLLVQALDSATSVGRVFAEDADVRLASVDPVAAPWLLLAGVAALSALAWAPAQPTGPAWSASAMAALILGGIATLALLAVPLAVLLAALVGLAFLLLASDARIGATAVLLVAVGMALPSSTLTGVAALAVVVAGARWLRPGQTPESRMLGGALTPPAAALAVWAMAETLAVDEALRGYPVLLMVGLLALALPRPEIEATGWLAALIAAPLAVEAAADPETATAIHLTLAGALVVTSSLVHPHRRALGWAGGLLLAAATWVRLADIGVEAPEAYTLPSALALLGVGAHRLHRDPDASTAVALTPGLLLATVPSLLWCLDDPVSWRAVWLGLACLGLVLAGTLARLSAPLVVGGAVGGVLVVRELAPYAAETPQWILIGAAGALLTLVGVTWEHRLVEVRRAAAYLDRLR